MSLPSPNKRTVSSTLTTGTTVVDVQPNANMTTTAGAAALSAALASNGGTLPANFDRRLPLVGVRKSGYQGHIPRCIYYDRERLPAPIHSGGNIPERGKFQMNGTMAATQSMIRDGNAKMMASQSKNNDNTADSVPNVASMNEIGIITGGGRGAGSFINAHGINVGMTSSSAHTDIPMTSMSRPFSRNPNGNSGPYSVQKQAGFSTTGTGGDFASTVSPPRSPTARYYKAQQENASNPDIGTGPESVQRTLGRHRHVGAGGVCCGTTDPSQYGDYLHHNDDTIHGTQTQLLPHKYGTDKVAAQNSRAQNRTGGYANDGGYCTSGAALLRSGGSGGAHSASMLSAARGASSSEHNDTNGGTAVRTGSGLTPFPRYPVVRGPHRMGPRGLESFLTN